MSELSMLQLRAGATIASLLEVVDIFRLIAVRDRLYPAFSASACKVPAQQGYSEYLRFLTIKILSTETPPLDYSPSLYIDQLWHAHILDTQAWFELTDKFPRERLIHDPCPPEGLHAARLQNTITRYIEMFAEPPLREKTHAIWHESHLPPVTQNNSNILTPPRSVSPASSNATLDIPAPVTAPSWPASHARILIYYNEDSVEAGQPDGIIESHTNDTIASIIRKYQTKRDLSETQLQHYTFWLMTPGDRSSYEYLCTTGKTLGMYLASSPLSVKRLAKSVEVRILSQTIGESIMYMKGC